MTDTKDVNKTVVKAAIAPITVKEMCIEMPHVFRVGGQQVGEKATSYRDLQIAYARDFK